MLLKGEIEMREKLITISLYMLLALIVCINGVYWFLAFVVNDILNYYYGGILKFIFIFTIAVAIMLPIIKYRKHHQKWILPMVLSLMVVITLIFNNGLLRFVEDDLRDFSQEKWERHKELRIYMLNDLELHHLYKGQKEEDVKRLLGEPVFISGEKSQRYVYGISPGFLDPIMFYVEFENGVLAETDMYQS